MTISGRDTDFSESLPDWLTLRQFCTLIGKSRLTVLKWIHAEQLTAFKVGGVWRIYRPEYYRYQSEGLLPKN